MGKCDCNLESACAQGNVKGKMSWGSEMRKGITLADVGKDHKIKYKGRAPMIRRITKVLMWAEVFEKRDSSIAAQGYKKGYPATSRCENYVIWIWKFER